MERVNGIRARRFGWLTVMFSRIEVRVFEMDKTRLECCVCPDKARR